MQQQKPDSDQAPGRFATNGRGQPPAPPPTTAAAPSATPAAPAAWQFVPLVTAGVLTLVTLVQTLLIIPTLTSGWRDLGREQRQLKEWETRNTEAERELEQSRANAVITQAKLVEQQEAARKVAEENLRLANEINKTLHAAPKKGD